MVVVVVVIVAVVVVIVVVVVVRGSLFAARCSYSLHSHSSSRSCSRSRGRSCSQLHGNTGPSKAQVNPKSALPWRFKKNQAWTNRRLMETNSANNSYACYTWRLTKATRPINNYSKWDTSEIKRKPKEHQKKTNRRPKRDQKKNTKLKMCLILCKFV